MSDNVENNSRSRVVLDRQPSTAAGSTHPEYHGNTYAAANRYANPEPATASAPSRSRRRASNTAAANPATLS